MDGRNIIAGDGGSASGKNAIGGPGGDINLTARDLNNLSIQEITIIQTIEIIQELVNKMPDGKEKRSLLESLSSLSTNPLFAQLAGTTLGSLLASLLH